MYKTIENENELYEITGGISFTSSVLNALSTCARTILELGRSFGSALRRTVTGNLCD